MLSSLVVTLVTTAAAEVGNIASKGAGETPPLSFLERIDVEYYDRQAVFELTGKNWDDLKSYFQKLQDDFVVWHNHNFPDANELEVVAGLAEEAGEVCRGAVKMSQGIRGSREEWLHEIEKECADVFIKLMDVSRYYEFDLLTAIQSRWSSVRQRNWIDDPQSGGQNVKRK